MAAHQGMEAPLHSASTHMELGGEGRGADDRVWRQLQAVGRLVAYLMRRIPPLRGRQRCCGDETRGWGAPRGMMAAARWIGMAGRPHTVP